MSEILDKHKDRIQRGLTDENIMRLAAGHAASGASLSDVLDFIAQLYEYAEEPQDGPSITVIKRT